MIDMDIIDALNSIEQDSSVPKNIRFKVKEALDSLQNNGKKQELIFDEVLQQLDDLSSDPNLPQYTRAQIWSVVCCLEKK